MCIRDRNYRVEGELNYIKVERPFDLVAVDLFGPLPKGRGGVVSVSYTHLDVYKRQFLDDVTISFANSFTIQTLSHF